MSAMLDQIEELELQANEDVEQLLSDEANGVKIDPKKAKQIIVSAGLSFSDYKKLLTIKRQRAADARIVSESAGVLRDAIGQEQSRSKLIADAQAKIEAIQTELAQKLSSLEAGILEGQQLDGKRRQAIKRLIATAPASLLQEQHAMAQRINHQKDMIEHTKDQIAVRQEAVRKRESRLEKTADRESKAKAENELAGAEARLQESRELYAGLVEEKQELTRQMNDILSRKLLP